MAVLKLFHVLFIFTWMGTLLTVSRLMGYLGKEEAAVQRRLALLCRRIYLLVDIPSMVLSIGLGVVLLFLKDINFKAPWFHMKMTFAAILIITDLITGRLIIKQARSPQKGSGTCFKILHGIAGLALIGVLIAIYILKQRG